VFTAEILQNLVVAFVWGGVCLVCFFHLLTNLSADPATFHFIAYFIATATSDFPSKYTAFWCTAT